MYFSDSRAHAIPLFVSSGILPLNLHTLNYFKSSAILMDDVTNHCDPPNISELFIGPHQIHSLQVSFTSRDLDFINNN